MFGECFYFKLFGSCRENTQIFQYTKEKIEFNQIE